MRPPSLTPQRTRQVCITVNLVGLAVNGACLIFNLVVSNWFLVSVETLVCAIHTVMVNYVVRHAQLDELEIKKREADVASSEHAAVIMAKQREFVTREFVQAAAGERRH